MIYYVDNEKMPLSDYNISSSSSSSLFVQIKIHDANKEHMIKPEQDSKVEKPHLLLPLNRKRKKKRRIA